MTDKNNNINNDEMNNHQKPKNNLIFTLYYLSKK